MDTSITKIKSRNEAKIVAACCSDAACDSGRRNRYFPGKRMTPDAFRVEQTYELERRRLLNRAIHGKGVVYGFGLKLAPAARLRDDGGRLLLVTPGLALDACGRELLQVDTLQLGLGDLLTFDSKGCPIAPDERNCRGDRLDSPWCSERGDCWLLCVHYAERLISPLSVGSTCGCDGHEWDQVCETVCYSLRRIPCEQCCPDHGCELRCDCGRGACCDGAKMSPDDAASPPGVQVNHRGGCRCLCDYLTQLNPNPDDCHLCEIRKGHWVDIGHGIPLACLRLDRDNCQCFTFGSIVDDCGPRPLVKRNDLLFDLIRGCDLTHIRHVGWADWHRTPEPVPWQAFKASFREGSGPHESKYWIEFSKPVLESSVRRDCFIMQVIAHSREGGWGEALRVPVTHVRKHHRTGDPDDTVRSAELIFDPAWIEQELEGHRTIFRSKVHVELEIRGDYIVDCNNLTLDVRTRGLAANPTGHGVPGGTFYSSFNVAHHT